MAKRKIPKGQINRRNGQTIKAIKQLMEDMGQKYSIRVGILGSNGAQKREGTDLTNAELGAIHEFGATINVTDKMRGYFWHQYGINKSNEPINIPARSFLRVPLLSKEGQERILNKVILDGDRELNKLLAESRQFKDKDYMKTLATAIGAEGYQIVYEAFLTGGYPHMWEPTKEWSKQHRKYNPENPTLVDSGQLWNSITFDVKETK